MLCQVVHQDKFLLAIRTAEWLFSKVDTIMLSQVVLLDEFLLAIRTGEWLFSKVDPFMLSQVIFQGKFLLAIRTVAFLQSGYYYHALSGHPSGQISSRNKNG